MDRVLGQLAQEMVDAPWLVPIELIGQFIEQFDQLPMLRINIGQTGLKKVTPLKCFHAENSGRKCSLNLGIMARKPAAAKASRPYAMGQEPWPVQTPNSACHGAPATGTAGT